MNINVPIGIFRKGIRKMKKTLGIATDGLMIALVVSLVFMAFAKPSVQVEFGSASKRSASVARLETAYAVGIIQGWPTMIFVSEDAWSTNQPDRLVRHIQKGVSRIFSYNNISNAPSGCTLTFFTNNDSGSGWTSAYPTSSAQSTATNSITTSMGISTKGMTSLPDGCEVALGWLCYVPDGFWSSHSQPVSFTDLKNLKGAWLYR